MKEHFSILIIEDDPVIIEFLQTGLRYEGYEVTACNTGKEGLEKVRSHSFDLLILDVMLPDTDGYEICSTLRLYGHTLPILMLTVRKEVSDRIRGLDSGADDYLVKPFSFDELLARMRALLRRSGQIASGDLLRSGNIALDRETREVKVAGKPVSLTPTEFSLLELLLRYPRKAFTRETLLNRVLGYDYDGGTNIIDVHISHLRKKIGDTEAGIIRTIYGIGYAYYPQE